MTRKITALIPLCTVMLSACGAEQTQTTKASVELNRAASPMTPLMEGKLLFARCKACHTLDQDGKHLVGPNLYDTIGKLAGQKKGFVYSKSMANSGIIWTDDILSEYLANPAAYLPKNRMVFVGLRDETDRQKVILYLKSETMPDFVMPRNNDASNIIPETVLPTINSDTP